MALSTVIQDHMDKICETLCVGRAYFDDLRERVDRCEKQPERRDFYDEQVWTFLLAASYAIKGGAGATQLGLLLTEGQHCGLVEKLWFEFLPIPPRVQEGNTHLDLALGAIAKRAKTQSGIEYAPNLGDFVCFCEFKWCSDISIDVTYDRHRNQLARVVENALCFQGGERFPNRVHVTLVTPAVFFDRSIRSRLYQYKFPEYDKCHDQLIAEFNACRLSKRDEDSFRYPDLTQRMTCLHLHWVSFQSLREAAPDSPIKAPFQEFASRFDGTGH
jgi:hypothetical protein